MALSPGRQRGFDINEQTLLAIAEHTEADLNGAIDDYRKGKGQPGGVIRAGYALWALEAAGWPRDETTASVAHYLTVIQGDHKRWPPQSNRPPSESSAFTATALALRGVQAFAQPAPDQETTEKAGPKVETATALRARALEWLEQTKPKETEDRVFRLWGLKHASARPGRLPRPPTICCILSGPTVAGASSTHRRNQPKRRTRRTKLRWRPLVRCQRRLCDRLSLGGASLGRRCFHRVTPYRRGLQFLIRSQRNDGTWFIKSRSSPFQAYFESGFPHGPDQFISAAGSGWATAALVLACPRP